MSVLRHVVLVVLAISLLGCGFKLRNDFSISEQFKTIALHSQEKHSALAKTLSKRLGLLGVNVLSLNASKGEHYTLVLLPEKLDRRLLSLFASGQVAEYELIYTCRYQLHAPDGDITDLQFELLREYQDDPDQVLAKSRELDLILDELQSEASDRIIRQFSLEQI